MKISYESISALFIGERGPKMQLVPVGQGKLYLELSKEARSTEDWKFCVLEQVILSKLVVLVTKTMAFVFSLVPNSDDPVHTLSIMYILFKELF